MKTKYIPSIMGLTCTLLILFSCNGNSNSNKSATSSSSSSSSSKTEENTYYNVSGGSSSSISTCKTCGISYTVASLPFGKYCSQNCCAAYEGLSSKCGY